MYVVKTDDENGKHMEKASLVCTALLLATVQSSAQWVVTDPGNLAQGIINMSDNIAHTSKTATNTAQSFFETVKIYEQSKNIMMLLNP